jgi:hypothetical protein
MAFPLFFCDWLGWRDVWDGTLRLSYPVFSRLSLGEGLPDWWGRNGIFLMVSPSGDAIASLVFEKLEVWVREERREGCCRLDVDEVSGGRNVLSGILWLE